MMPESGLSGPGSWTEEEVETGGWRRSPGMSADMPEEESRYRNLPFIIIDMISHLLEDFGISLSPLNGRSIGGGP
jgi:hypothetical protein